MLQQIERLQQGAGELVKQILQAFSSCCRTIWDSGSISMALSAAFFSISSFLVKLTGGRVPTFEIVTFRSTVSFILCAFGARQAHISPLFGKRAHLPLLIGRGLFGASAMTTYYLSIQALPLADAVTLFFLNPAITAVAAWLLLNEPLGWLGLGGVVLSLIGLVILSQPPFLFQSSGMGWDRKRVLGTSYGLVSALCATGAFVCIRMIGKREPALVMSVYFHTYAFLSSALPLAVGVPSPAILPSGLDFLLLCGIAVMSFWGQILVGRAFQLLAAAKASAINFTQVLYSYIFGIVLLHEDFSLWGVLGSVLIASGVLLVSLRRKPKGNCVAEPDTGVSTVLETEAQPLMPRSAVPAGSSSSAVALTTKCKNEKDCSGAVPNEHRDCEGAVGVDVGLEQAPLLSCITPSDAFQGQGCAAFDCNSTVRVDPTPFKVPFTVFVDSASTVAAVEEGADAAVSGAGARRFVKNLGEQQQTAEQSSTGHVSDILTTRQAIAECTALSVHESQISILFNGRARAGDLPVAATRSPIHKSDMQTHVPRPINDHLDENCQLLTPQTQGFRDVGEGQPTPTSGVGGEDMVELGEVVHVGQRVGQDQRSRERLMPLGASQAGGAPLREESPQPPHVALQPFPV